MEPASPYIADSRPVLSAARPGHMQSVLYFSSYDLSSGHVRAMRSATVRYYDICCHPKVASRRPPLNQMTNIGVLAQRAIVPQNTPIAMSGCPADSSGQRLFHKDIQYEVLFVLMDFDGYRSHHIRAVRRIAPTSQCYLGAQDPDVLSLHG